MSSEATLGCGAYAKVVLYLHIGNREAALSALYKAAVQHCFWMCMVYVDPAFDPLREAPA